jgi:hypothetical protein
VIKQLFIVMMIFPFALKLQAVGTSELPIQKGAAIEVVGFDAVAQVVEVKIVNESAVGPNYADKKDLVRAAGLTGSQKERFQENPLSLKGVVLNLKKDLKLLNYFELKQRLPKTVQKQLDQQEARGRKDALKKDMRSPANSKDQ